MPGENVKNKKQHKKVKSAKIAKKAKTAKKAHKAKAKFIHRKTLGKHEKAIKPAPMLPKDKKKTPSELRKEQELLVRKKLYAEQEKLWAGKLITILSDSYIRQAIIDLAGENALEIIRNFSGELSDEDMSKKLKLKISDVRATLNKLHNESLVQYNRQKDSETGRYSYSWALNKIKIERWANNQQSKRMFVTNGVDHYFCPGCGPESITPFVQASEAEFRCGCGKGLEFLDEEKIQALSKR